MSDDCHVAYDEDLANRNRELIAPRFSFANPVRDRFEMRLREMKGWLRADAESVSTKRTLESLVMQSVAFASALPPKENE
jgi:hypothetical protein